MPTASEVVTVTARKREEEAAKIPVAVTSVSGDDLQRNDMRSVADMAQLVPNLNINGDSVARSFVSIRGIGTALQPSVEPGVGIFLDGVYLPSTAYANNPTLDVERIEVLKGPQGTLYGKNTLGGAINIVTRRPTDAFEAQVTVDYSGSDASNGETVRVSGPIGSTLRGRLAASRRESDGFFENSLAGGPMDDSSSDSVNGSLIWSASPTLNVSTNLYKLDLTGPMTNYGVPAGPRSFDDGIYKLNVTGVADMTYKGGNLRFDYDASAIGSRFAAIVAYDEQMTDTNIDADFSPVDMFRQIARNERQSKTTELRVDTTWSSAVSTLFGVFGSSDEQDNSNVTTVVPINVSVPARDLQTADARAIFGTLFWKPADDLEVTAGLRYDRNEATLESASDPLHPRRTIETSHAAPRVSITKFWSPEQMTYFSVARGDREGGFNSTVVPEHLWVIQPDRVWAAELGQKTTFGTNNRTRVATSLFYIDYSNFIGQNTFVLRPDGNGYAGAVVNQGDATSYGVESEFSHQILPQWFVSGDVAYQRPRASNQDGWIAATGAPLATDRLIFQPDWNFNLRTEYSIPVGPTWMSFAGGIYGKGDAVAATQKRPPAEAPILDSYYLLNASVSVAYRSMQVRLYGTNLSDQGYWSSYIDDSLIGVPLGIQGPKRKVGLQVVYNWF